MLTNKQILRQRTDSEIGYNDWVIANELHWFYPDGKVAIPLKSLNGLGIQGFYIDEIAAMEVVGTTIDIGETKW